MLLKPDDRILFTGDSITNGFRGLGECGPFGVGYVLMTAARIMEKFEAPGLQIFNRGVSGIRMTDLLASFDKDCLALKPTVVSILIGVNDTNWQMGETPPPDTYEADMRAMLGRIRKELKARVVLLEPFLLHTSDARLKARPNMNARIDMVRRLSVEFGTDLIPLDGLFARAAVKTPPDFWAFDGIHPTKQGHALISQAWLENAGIA